MPRTSFEVQRTACSTCIYKKDCPLDIQQLEDQIKDIRGDFEGYRVCHHSGTACCRGFWNRHKDDFPAGQIAQRLNAVEYVDHDVLVKRCDECGKAKIHAKGLCSTCYMRRYRESNPDYVAKQNLHDRMSYQKKPSNFDPTIRARDAHGRFVRKDSSTAPKRLESKHRAKKQSFSWWD